MKPIIDADYSATWMILNGGDCAETLAGYQGAEHLLRELADIERSLYEFRKRVRAFARTTPELLVEQSTEPLKGKRAA
jgi:hypothetical protein